MSMAPGLRRVSDEEIARACEEEPRGCGAPPGQPCVSHLPWNRGQPLLDKTHVNRSGQSPTGSLRVIRDVGWSGPERRRWAEADIRADERAMVVQRVEAWLSTLPLDDRAHAAALAIIDVIRGQR